MSVGLKRRERKEEGGSMSERMALFAVAWYGIVEFNVPLETV